MCQCVARLIEPMYLHMHRFCFTIRYHYCLRIYNRFNWNKFYSSRWQEENEADEERRNFGDLDPNSSSDLKTIVPVKNLQKIGTTSKNREGWKSNSTNSHIVLLSFLVYI